MILLRTLYFLAGRHNPRTGEEWPCNPFPTRLCPPILLLLAGLVFSSCSGLNFGGTPAKVTPTAGSSQVALSQLHWCGKPLIIFRDEGATAPGSVTPTATATTTGTPTATAGNTPTPTATAASSTHKPVTITDWSQVEPNLGFVVYLPETLPQSSCLVSASGTVHDPIFGGSFTIGYLLPDHTSVSLAEAPLHAQSREFQCSSAKGDTGSASEANIRVPSSSATPAATASPTQTPILLCTGVRDNTNVVFSGRGTEVS